MINFLYVVDIECMARECLVILTEDMVLDLITRAQTREKYQKFAFASYVNVSTTIPNYTLICIIH